jgi:hypothetical protein
MLSLKTTPNKILYYSHFNGGHPCAALCCHNNVPALDEHGTKTKAKTKKPQQHANILVTFHEHFDDLSKRQKMKRSRLDLTPIRNFKKRNTTGTWHLGSEKVACWVP